MTELLQYIILMEQALPLLTLVVIQEMMEMMGWMVRVLTSHG